jgi:DNA polymerase-4
MMERLESIAQSLEHRLKKHNISGKTITIKYSDFTQQTRVKPSLFYF